MEKRDVMDVLSEFDPLSANPDDSNSKSKVNDGERRETTSLEARSNRSKDIENHIARAKSNYDTDDEVIGSPTSFENSSREPKDGVSSDVPNNEEEQFFDFQLFAKQFKSPTAEPLIKYTKSFLHNFIIQRNIWTPEEQHKLIYDFKIFIYKKFLLYEPFKSMKGAQLTNAKEGVEKLVMGKLYNRCFSPCIKEIVGSIDEGHEKDLIDDELLMEKINEYRFIDLENLDIPQEISSKLSKFVTLACKELAKINKFKAPRDKIVCILNCCKVIFGLLKHHNLEADGADSFIPLLIFIILRGNIPRLVSNVRYIERFRLDELFRGEESYYLSSLQGAITFIQSMDRQSLSITDIDTFEQLYQKNKQSLIQEAAAAQQETQIQQEREQTTGNNPLDEVANSMISLFNDFFSPQPSTTGSPTRDNSNTAQHKDEEHFQELIQQVEENEHKECIATLKSMFPDIDEGIIEDICIAKRHRIGICVDTLLSLFN